jgi:hypothetical protein
VPTITKSAQYSTKDPKLNTTSFGALRACLYTTVIRGSLSTHFSERMQHNCVTPGRLTSIIMRFDAAKAKGRCVSSVRNSGSGRVDAFFLSYNGSCYAPDNPPILLRAAATLQSAYSYMWPICRSAAQLAAARYKYTLAAFLISEPSRQTNRTSTPPLKCNETNRLITATSSTPPRTPRSRRHQKTQPWPGSSSHLSETRNHWCRPA